MSNETPTTIYPKKLGTARKAIIHPARGQSNARQGRGVWYEINWKVNDGEQVYVYDSTVDFDVMKRYQWIWIQSLDADCDKCGWASIQIPLEEMFESVVLVKEPNAK